MTETAVIHLTYTLQENEMLRYYEFGLQNNPETRKARMHAATWIPMGSLIFLIFLKAAWYWWIIAVLISIVWVLLLSQMIFNDVSRTSAKRKFQSKQLALSELDVIDHGDRLTVNRADKEVTGYCSYLDLLIIQLDGGSNLIIPERVFERDKDKMHQFVKDIAVMGEINSSKTTK
ncbi:MAG: hypothetical protein EOM64_01595 [Erysipelotrichia bacterium]|nr:hypothetical protein [Erysipelotrichia bacterium]